MRSLVVSAAACIAATPFFLQAGLADKPRSNSGSTMAQKWRVPRRSHPKPRPPLDGESLRELALVYVGRYATTRAKLRRYLERKLYERGWDGEGRPPVARIVDDFAARGYIDDRAFAASKAAALSRRGYGARRVDEALFAAGIDEADGAEAREIARESAWDAALAFARKRRIGPFAPDLPDDRARQKALAAMMRAGHDYTLARRLVFAEPGLVPDPPD